MSHAHACFRAATVDGVAPPYNTLHLKVFYPVRSEDGTDVPLVGAIPADPVAAPFPVVVFFNGMNCGMEQYQWLALRLAATGIVVVTFNWVAEYLPGLVGLTPGVDLQACLPDQYGTRPTASALSTVLRVLDHLQSQGELAGLLDLHQIVLGGHSAGGRVAIENANPDLFPSVVAAFAYAAHSMGVMQLGHAPNTLLPLPDAVPVLLIGGTRDGVIAHSGDRYGQAWATATAPLIRTFEEAIAGGRQDSYLLLLDGANHFSISHPVDPSTARLNLDFTATQPEEQIRDRLSEAIALFIDAHVRQHSEALQTLQSWLTEAPPLVTLLQRK